MLKSIDWSLLLKIGAFQLAFCSLKCKTGKLAPLGRLNRLYELSRINPSGVNNINDSPDGADVCFHFFYGVDWKHKWMLHPLRCLWLTLVWRVWIPGCPQLDNEERWPADSIHQHNDQGHPHRLWHGFSDTWWWGGGAVRGSIIKGAARRVGVGLLAIRAVHCLLMRCCSCCCHMFPVATVTLNIRWYIVITSRLAVECVIVGVVICTL